MKVFAQRGCFAAYRNGHTYCCEQCERIPDKVCVIAVNIARVGELLYGILTIIGNSTG